MASNTVTVRKAEERFLSAMNLLVGWMHEKRTLPKFCRENVRAAVEAFADARCDAECCGPHAGCAHPPVSERVMSEHAACRTRLLARVLGESDGR